ncbi:MAG: 7TM diverse intracellular signaling domain-containing protein, partial [Balneolaceae bacterium]
MVIRFFFSGRCFLLRLAAGIFTACVLLVLAYPLLARQLSADTFKISEQDMENQERIIYITDQWKFQSGDNPAWSGTEFDDSEWPVVSTFLSESDLAFMDWEGHGWFRISLQPDSSLVNVPLALLIDSHYGASEIYLDGVQLYSLGEFSLVEERTVPYADYMPRAIVFRDTEPHLLSVRFANHDPDPFLEMYGSAGFRFHLGDLEYHYNQKFSSFSERTVWQMFTLGGLIAFSLIHLLLYFFYPGENRNLYFGLFTGFLALLTYTFVKLGSIYSPADAILFLKLGQIIWIVTIIYALRFTYSLLYLHRPAQFQIFVAGGAAVSLAVWFHVPGFELFRELIVLVSVLEMLRVLLKIFKKKESGAWIIGAGLLCFLVAIVYNMGINMNLVTGDIILGNYLGSGILILSMSVFLSRDFALTQRKLEHKLSEVQELSRRTLEQEKLNREKELEKKLLEAENERKSNELEEARALQLTMLPKKLPDTGEWDISVFMETATEVGGDYYDFNVSKDGCMTIVVGDATGHGMKAGIMVATAKSYFHTLAGEDDLLTILRRMSSGFRNLDL